MLLCFIHTVLTGFTLLLFCDMIMGRFGDLETWSRRLAGPSPEKKAPNHTSTNIRKFTGNKKKPDTRGEDGGSDILLRSWKQNLRDDKNNESEDDWINQSLDPYNIHQQMKKMAKRFPKANITTEVIARTVEYNDLVLMKISQKKEKKQEKRFRSNDEAKYVKGEQEKKIIFIVHGLSVKGFRDVPALWELPVFEKLLNYYFEHLDVFDIFLIPMANPDGLTIPKVFWDKNLSPQAACPGVNLDRNFNVAWNSSNGISSCSQHYPGPTPFSEIETRAIQNVFHYYNNKIIAFINVKGGTYVQSTFKGEAVLYPKGYTDTQDDDDLYLDLKGELGEVMRNISFRTMSITVDTLYSWYGPISGSSVDYASTEYGVPVALEFVMQSYEMGFNFEAFKQEISYDSLNVIWGKIIYSVFNTIWKGTNQQEQ